ncbi:MAG: pilus (MSHA type) biogenesis protein MshL [Gammaproteobacteria bacterium RBG_16_57_12]|nr:MAG: pilus (MSHA type) biogenesis protein MshL [Gammaproteobacteria bacterium RBG_16_57_12]
MVLSGCAGLPGHWQKDIRRNVGDEYEKAAMPRNMVIPADVSQGLLPPVEAKVPEVDAEEIPPRYDLAANKTPAREVFMSLVKGTPYSMVVHPDITGEISLRLQNVTIDEVLQVMRHTYGFAYRRDGNRYMILGQGLQTQIFPVNYLNFNRKGHSNTRVSSSELTQVNNASENGTTSSTSTTHGIEIRTDSASDFWKELKESLQAIIGEKDGRRVVSQPQAGLMVVRAMPDELVMVEKYLGITQATVNRQVILEAKIIEVELNDSFKTGINWSALGTSGNTSVLASQTGGGTLLNSGVSEISGLAGNLQPGGSYTPIASATMSAFGGVFSLTAQAKNFSAFLELLKMQGDVHVLSSPRVSTVNNQRAVIKIGGDEFFVTGISSSSTTSGSSTTETPTVELTPFFSGIALDVTPQIDEKNNVILHIHPTVSNVSQKDKNFMVSGRAFSLPLAISNIQESDNVVRAETGQVIVIGGLMKEATSEDNASIPLLGDIPVVGNLFKHQRLIRVKKELVILLKPTVVDNSQLWTESIRSSQQRTDSIMQEPR